MLTALHVGGWIQGMQLNDPSVPFVSTDPEVTTILGTLKPYLFARSISGVLLTVGHVVFAVNFFWMLVGGRRTQRDGSPTLLAPEYLERRA